MSVLNTKRRNRLAKTSFAIHEGRKYPIYDLAHARAALVYMVRLGRKRRRERSVAR